MSLITSETLFNSVANSAKDQIFLVTLVNIILTGSLNTELIKVAVFSEQGYNEDEDG